MNMNPITELLKTKRAELNEALIYYELQFRRGKISFEEYSSTTKKLIKEYYAKYSSEDVYRDSEPKGLLGIVVRAIRKLF